MTLLTLPAIAKRNKQPRVASAFNGMYRPVVAHMATWIGVLNSMADTPCIARFFVSATRQCLYGRAVWGAFVLSSPWTATPTCTVPLSMIGVMGTEF